MERFTRRMRKWLTGVAEVWQVVELVGIWVIGVVGAVFLHGCALDAERVSLRPVIPATECKEEEET